MNSEPGVWEESTRIHSYDVDFKHRARLDALCRYFLEAAWNHADALGVGFAQLRAQRRFWVLSRLIVEAERYPVWGQTVRLHTWPRGSSGLFAWRDFEVLDPHGRRLAGGSSGWLVLDSQSRRPQRLDRLNWPFKTLPDKRATTREPQKLPDNKAAELSFITTVRFSDVDVNNHVNSAVYIRWLLDSRSVEFHRSHTVRQLEVNYTSETLSGDAVSVFARSDAGAESWHRICKSAGEETCRAHVLWSADTAQEGPEKKE